MVYIEGIRKISDQVGIEFTHVDRDGGPVAGGDHGVEWEEQAFCAC